MMGRLTGAAGCALGIAVAGCYTFQPVADVAPRPGQEVRVQLAEPMSHPLGEVTLHGVQGVEGVVHEASADVLAVWTRWLYTNVGARHEGGGGLTYVPRDNVATLEARRLAAGPTVVAVGTSIGAGVALFRLVEEVVGGGGGSTTEPGPPPTAARATPLPPVP